MCSSAKQTVFFLAFINIMLKIHKDRWKDMSIYLSMLKDDKKNTIIDSNFRSRCRTYYSHPW